MDHSSGMLIDARESGSASVNADVPNKMELASPSAAPRDFKAALANGSGLKYVMDLIYTPGDGLSKEMQVNIMRDTISNWNEHINPGFLQYRKSVADDFAAIEWRDGRPGGATVISATGAEYIDCLGGFGIYNCGHSHPVIVDAVKRQMDKQSLHSQELLDPLRAYCAALLAKTLPGDLQYSFFTNSGTESVEAVLKMAMLSTGRKKFIGVVGAFHGKSLGSLSGTSKSVFRKPFGGGLLDFTHIPVNDCEALRRAFESSAFTGDEIAGFIVEPILGEGGIHVCSKEFLQLGRKLCDEYGACLIFDEVQSGMGRSGKYWACEWSDVAPDLMAIGKAFGGGVAPAGAAVGNYKAWHKYFENPFLHTTTFGGNPCSMAASIACMAVIENERLVQAAHEKGEWLKEKLHELQSRHSNIMAGVRGRGLMLGMVFPTDDIGYNFSKGVFKRNIVLSGTLINSKVLRVEPPLTITYDEMQTVLDRFEETLEELQQALVGTVPPRPQVAAAAAAALPTISEEKEEEHAEQHHLLLLPKKAAAAPAAADATSADAAPAPRASSSAAEESDSDVSVGDEEAEESEDGSESDTSDAASLSSATSSLNPKRSSGKARSIPLRRGAGKSRIIASGSARLSNPSLLLQSALGCSSGSAASCASGYARPRADSKATEATEQLPEGEDSDCESSRGSVSSSEEEEEEAEVEVQDPRNKKAGAV